MRQTISGPFAAFAVLFAGAAPAMACGYSTCAPTYNYVTTGCNSCGTVRAYRRLAEPETQYYYVNQGPTYTGPGALAPYPVYHETAVTGWAGYERAPSPYGGGHAWHHSNRNGYMPPR